MAKRSISDLYISDVTWEKVLEVAKIPLDSPVAKRITTNDNPPYTLHHFMNGTHEFLLRFLCQSDETFQKVKDAVLHITENAPSKRAYIVEHFPSPSDYGKRPNSKDVFDHRGGSSGLHTSLQVEAFGNFIDVMNMNEDEIDSECYKVATSLMQEMSKVFPTEMDRQQVFLQEVEKLLPRSSAVNSKGVMTDATIRVMINNKIHHLANYEFKNEMKNITSDPFHQNNGYFVHLQHIAMERSPMLLINVIGCHHLQVFGAVWNGGHVCVDPLCSPVSLLFVPRDPNGGVAKTACVLAAIKSTLGKLQEYYGCSERFHKGPYWRYKDLPYKEMSGSKWLFEADDDGQEVVVKFARSYGEDVHRFLAAEGLAPQLFECQRIAGGWYAVVMEKVAGSPLQCPVDKPVKESFEAAVRGMHEKGYVHGDLRPQNILVFDKGVYILDFDWAGKCEVARYPKELNMSGECNWHCDVQPGGRIAAEHDTYQLQRISVNGA